MAATQRSLARAVVMLQGIYYVLTGAWPLVHLASFEAVTGPKVEETGSSRRSGSSRS